MRRRSKEMFYLMILFGVKWSQTSGKGTLRYEERKPAAAITRGTIFH